MTVCAYSIAMGNPSIRRDHSESTPCIECVNCLGVVTEPAGATYRVYVNCGFDYRCTQVLHFVAGCKLWESALPKLPGRWRQVLIQSRRELGSTEPLHVAVDQDLGPEGWAP